MTEPLTDEGAIDMPTAVRRIVDRVSKAQWLAPDAEMQALDPPARRWIDERVGEHLANLARVGPSPLEVRPAEVVRDMLDVATRWEDAWTAVTSSPYLDAIDAVARSTGRMYEMFPGRELEARREADMLHLHVRGVEVWSHTFNNGGQDGFGLIPGVLCAKAHVRWLLAFGLAADQLSPWEPLFALWERGVWALPLPDATVLVYVPVLVDGRVVPSPAAPELGVPRRRPRPAIASSPIPRLTALGCGPGPGLDPAPAPCLAPPMVRTGAVMSVPPYPPRPVVLPMPVATAMPAAPPAPPAPTTADRPPTPPETMEVPWYRRLFGLD